jgi:hypothetical protein
MLNWLRLTRNSKPRSLIKNPCSTYILSRWRVMCSVHLIRVNGPRVRFVPCDLTGTARRMWYRPAFWKETNLEWIHLRPTTGKMGALLLLTRGCPHVEKTPQVFWTQVQSPHRVSANAIHSWNDKHFQNRTARFLYVLIYVTALLNSFHPKERQVLFIRNTTVRTNVSEELSASIIRVTSIGELGTLAGTSNRRTLLGFLRGVLCLIVTANVVRRSQSLVTTMTKELRSSETSVLTTATRRNIQEDGILQEYNYLFWNLKP